MFNNIGALMPSIRAVRKETELGRWTQPRSRRESELAHKDICGACLPRLSERAWPAIFVHRVNAA
jgi:hypothetical protein